MQKQFKKNLFKRGQNSEEVFYSMPYPFVYNKYKRGSQPYSLGTEVVHRHNSPASAFAAFQSGAPWAQARGGNECLKQAITACFYLTSSVLHRNTAVCTAVSGLCF